MTSNNSIGGCWWLNYLHLLSSINNTFWYNLSLIPNLIKTKRWKTNWQSIDQKTHWLNNGFNRFSDPCVTIPKFDCIPELELESTNQLRDWPLIQNGEREGGSQLREDMCSCATTKRYLLKARLSNIALKLWKILQSQSQVSMT